MNGFDLNNALGGFMQTGSDTVCNKTPLVVIGKALGGKSLEVGNIILIKPTVEYNGGKEDN